VDAAPDRQRRRLQARLRQQLMGLVSYLMFLAPLAMSVHEGWVRFGYGGLAAFAAIAVAINLGFRLAIRTGFSERFADPTLVEPQIVAAMLLALVVGYYTDQARIVTLMLFFTAFFFGVFSLTTRRYLVLSLVAIAGYATMLWLKLRVVRYDLETVRLELLYLLMLAMVLVWMSWLGGYVTRLRASLARRRDELAAALERVQQLASHDELTGVYNRRHLMELLEQQRERAQRHGEGLAVCILDLDHFKRINDVHGHLAGDDALRSFCALVRQQLRRMDVLGRAQVESSFGRYGGEEFLLLLPYTGNDGALQCLARLRVSLGEHPLMTCAGPLPMTFSAGVAEYRVGETASQVLARADAALYRAKANGRDRVEIDDGQAADAAPAA
jgi:diguanylate cyclase (GGDEF)-like protein